MSGYAEGGPTKIAGDGVVIVDVVRELEQVVLAVGVVEVEVGEVPEIEIHGQLPAAGEVVDAHAGDDAGGAGLVGVVRNDALRGVGLGPLQEVGQGVRALQAVLQDEAPDFQRLADMGIFGCAHGFLLLVY